MAAGKNALKQQALVTKGADIGRLCRRDEFDAESRSNNSKRLIKRYPVTEIPTKSHLPSLRESPITIETEGQELTIEPENASLPISSKPIDALLQHGGHLQFVILCKEYGKELPAPHTPDTQRIL